jgi:hypothetical protein
LHGRHLFDSCPLRGGRGGHATVHFHHGHHASSSLSCVRASLGVVEHLSDRPSSSPSSFTSSRSPSRAAAARGHVHHGRVELRLLLLLLMLQAPRPRLRAPLTPPPSPRTRARPCFSRSRAATTIALALVSIYPNKPQNHLPHLTPHLPRPSPMVARHRSTATAYRRCLVPPVLVASPP